jgi:hypothetical protein
VSASASNIRSFLIGSSTAFYLILSLAVGGTNGWFPDKVGNKPWLDGSTTAAREFIQSKDKWYPTWGNEWDRSMVM